MLHVLHCTYILTLRSFAVFTFMATSPSDCTIDSYSDTCSHDTIIDHMIPIPVDQEPATLIHCTLF